MGQKEEPEADDRQALDEGAEPRWVGRGQPEHKIYAGGLEEGHQLGSLTLHLEDIGQGQHSELESSEGHRRAQSQHLHPRDGPTSQVGWNDTKKPVWPDPPSQQNVNKPTTTLRLNSLRRGRALLFLLVISILDPGVGPE